MLGSHHQSKQIYRQFGGRYFARMRPLPKNRKKDATKEKDSIKKPSP